MDLLIYLKESAFSQWLSISMAGFPLLIALHSVGMAVAVGMSLMVTLRLHGFIAEIPLQRLPRLLGVTVAGFVLNLVTGLALFITRGPEYAASYMFLFKMALVAVGAVILMWLSRHSRIALPDADALADDAIARNVSLAGTAVLFGAVVAGRLIAYLSDLY